MRNKFLESFLLFGTINFLENNFCYESKRAN